MGIGGISIWNLLIILGIVVLLFGTAKLRNIGADLGGALKSFRNAIRDDDEPASGSSQSADAMESNQASGASQAGSTAERTEDRLQ